MKILVVAVVVAVAALEGCLGLVSLRPGSLTPGPLTNQPRVAFRAGFLGLPSRAQVRVNGVTVASRVDWPRGCVAVAPVCLVEGPNRVELRLFPLLPVRAVSAGWTVHLDQAAPPVSVDTPPVTREASVHLMGHTEPGATVSVWQGENPTDGVVDARGAFVVDLELPPGRTDLAVEAVDGAGNRTRLPLSMTCDRSPPTVRVGSPAADSVCRENRGPILVQVGDSESGLRSVRLTVDGREVPRKPEADQSGRLAWDPGILPEGRREVTLTAEDGAGWRSEETWHFTVDSTEQLGLCTVTLGAVGQDVRQLQRKLRDRGLLTDEDVTGVFDETTRAAVLAFQQEQGLEPDGLAGGATLAELGPRIVVYLDDFSLELVENGRVVCRYDIAHGQPAYPTPRGEFHVADMVENPTWLPPDSAWAREAKAIPPGPDNPLGTRWIGLNSHVVGIHGTNSEGSIGSRASHGCIRMRVADVEDLYSRVNLGVPVSIR
ncbi:MAG: L,D-transpeptidase family protein [Candidatus Eremiobacterota bacterium]